MIIKPVMDRETIESVVFHPEILSTISEDGGQPSLPDAFYIGGFDSECFGIFMVSPVSRSVADVHVHVLPKYRKTHALEFGRGVIDWVWVNTNIQKMNAQIPFCCENVKRFAEVCGFEVEGVNRKSWLKNGAHWDSWYLGIVR